MPGIDSMAIATNMISLIKIIIIIKQQRAYHLENSVDQDAFDWASVKNCWQSRFVVGILSRQTEPGIEKRLVFCIFLQKIHDLLFTLSREGLRRDIGNDKCSLRRCFSEKILGGRLI